MILLASNESFYAFGFCLIRIKKEKTLNWG